MKMDIDYTALEKRLLGLEKEARKEVTKAVVKNAVMYQAALIDAIQSGSRSGVTYGNHQASAPGEAPKTDKGRLVASIQTRFDANGLAADVYSKLPYAWFLEFGTSRVEARPVWVPLFKSMEDQMRETISAAVRRALAK
jgi:HK97 gp10 family phage protein